MEVPRLGVKSEQQLQADATATASATLDTNHILKQYWILNLLREARDQTCNLRVPTQIRSTAPQQELQ